jgi:hypothetical protein
MINSPKGEHTAPGVYISDIGATYVNNNYNEKNKTDESKTDVDALRYELNALKTQVNALTSIVSEIKKNMVTSIEGKKNQISSDRYGNKVIIKFDDNAHFIAGE